MIIDTHTHLLPDRLALAIRKFFDDHLPSHGTLAYPALHGDALRQLLAEGVDLCWSLPYAHKGGMSPGLNRWMAESYGAHPRVVAGAALHPDDDVPRVLDEALGELRLRVVKLHCSVGGFSPDDPRLDPLWRRVSEEGQPVVLHAGKSVLGTTTEAELEPVDRVATRWPAARIILAHCGGPSVARALALLRAHRSMLTDLTPVRSLLAALPVETIVELGDRFLFGSDAPNVSVTAAEARALIRAHGLPPEVEAAVFGGNARRLIA